MEGFIGTTYLPEPLRTTVNTNLSRLATTASLRCAAHEYRVAAAGHCHLWDHAAGWLLHHEAEDTAPISMARLVAPRISAVG